MNNFKSFFFLLFIFSVLSTNAQVGIGTTTPTAALDINSTNDGLLIPRVALTGTATVLPILTGTTSELVYNTATISDVTPGFYYLSTAIGPWVRLAAASASATTDWSVTGNTGIVDGTNYIGTAALTDVDVAFRRNNVASGKIGITNTSYGVGTLAANTSGTQSTAIGVNALASNQTASDNTAIGYNALQSNTTTGTHTAVGSGALESNTTGIENTGIGYRALSQNTSGGNNVAIGQETLATNSSGEHNTAVGHQSLQFNKSNRQTALGFQALQGDAVSALSAGADNTSVGYQSMQLATTGTGNSALGFHAGWFNSSGSNNVFLGRLAGSATTTGSNNVFLGNEAGSAEAGATSNKLYISNSATTPTTSLIYGDFTSSPKILRTNSQFQIGDPATTGYVFPTARGTNGQTLTTNGTGVLSWSSVAAPTSWDITGNTIASPLNFMGTINDFDVRFRRNNLSAGKIGSSSTAFGVGALSNDISTRNTAIGVNALTNSINLGTSNNVAVGWGALDATFDHVCSQNVAVGANALGSAGSGSNDSNNNVAIGFNSSQGLQSGNDNVSVGQGSLNNAVIVNNCTAVGKNALFSTTASDNTALGNLAGNAITTGTNNTAIGFNAQVAVATNSNQIRIGDGAISLATTQVAWSATSDRRLKSNIENSNLGLDFIKKLRPVSYFRTNDKDKKTEYGFIAQELELALTKAGDKNNGIISKDDAGMYAVRYNDFTSITIKAVQEQQEIIEQLKYTNTELLKTNAELLKSNLAILKRLEKLEKKKSE
ncbi:tail fiber domain-containing protein [Flavobacterium luteum]|uniref:Peptidase S74 domain-containing protein n=1 Tax=Flavobacterium luteum TaxID=2026654 RepID=A0A7J5AAV3_9FLAO|nr:tail fiber domain-containing protein [Flavobacterium luteum]KAB1154299.1 hypothetical protein F6464_13015 [Flavobacterium luteum]